MKRKIKAGYVAPEVLVVQLKTNGSVLITESASGAAGMPSGSFGARGGSFSTWDESYDEEY